MMKAKLEKRLLAVAFCIEALAPVIQAQEQTEQLRGE